MVSDTGLVPAKNQAVLHMCLVRIGHLMGADSLNFLMSNMKSFTQYQLLSCDQIVKQIRKYMFICMVVYVCKLCVFVCTN